MELFRYLLRSARRTFLLALGTSLVSGATGAGFIALVNLALARKGAVPQPLVWGFAAVCLATVGTRFLSQAMLYRLSQEAIYDLRLGLVKGILHAPLRRVEKLGTPRLFAALSDDVVVIADALPGLPLIFSSIAFIVGCLAYLASLSPAVALAALAAAVVGGLVYRLFAIYGMRFLERAREEQDQLFTHFHAITDGLKELKLNRRRRESFLAERLTPTATAYRTDSAVGLSIFEGAVGAGQAIFFLFIGVLLFLLPGHVDMSAKVLANSVLTILFGVVSVQGVLIWFPVLGRASVALRKVRDLRGFLANEAEDRTSGAPPAPLGRWRRLELRGVSHVYPGPTGEEFVLGPIELELRRGEVVFVVGGNGSGKTTLAKVITGLYPPESGTIRLDGTDIDDRNRDDYRQLFSAVFADFFLFDTLFGLPIEEGLVTARHYLSLLELDHKVSIDGDRFSTIELSQGQRKRLALLAAYLEDRPFYLFDEWAADQDPVFKEFFYTHLLMELKAKDKAVLVITHDDQYFHVADRVVRLDYGQIRQNGIPGEQPVVAANTAELTP